MLLKHLPKLEEIPQETKQLEDFVLNYKKQKKKAMLIYGPPGSGKTAAVHALAKKHNLELIEVNASDSRTEDDINTKLGPAIKQQSLFSQGKLIFVDELDGISGMNDRGGIPAIVELIKDSKFPILLTANDPWLKKISPLRSKSVLVEFPQISTIAMLPVLQKLKEKSNIKIDDDVLKALARRSGGDLRGAIIDLEIMSVTDGSMDSLNTLHDRHRAETMSAALMKIFKSTDPQLAMSVLDIVDEDFDEFMLYVDENLPKEYSGKSLARAYDSLSKADVYKGRIQRWQYWRYLSYAITLSTAGIAVAKDTKSPNIVEYKEPSRLLSFWILKQKYAKRNRIVELLSKAVHSSSKRAMKHTYPYMKGFGASLAFELKLDEEEREWLEGYCKS